MVVELIVVAVTPRVSIARNFILLLFKYNNQELLPSGLFDSYCHNILVLTPRLSYFTQVSIVKFPAAKSKSVLSGTSTKSPTPSKLIAFPNQALLVTNEASKYAIPLLDFVELSLKSVSACIISTVFISGAVVQ